VKCGKGPYRFPTFDHQSIQLVELTDKCLSLCQRRISNDSINVSLLLNCHVQFLDFSRSQGVCAFSIIPSNFHALTFNICNSFNPFWINSCTLRGSCSLLFSLNASLVLRFAYSLKLYAANCSLCRSSCRYWSKYNQQKSTEGANIKSRYVQSNRLRLCSERTPHSLLQIHI
jgi:hypothetical protein